MQMFWLALAAQLSAPTPLKPWLDRGDTPSHELMWRGYTEFLIRVTVDPNGTAQSCGVEESSGKPTIDAYTCDLTMKRAHFLPARTEDGKAAYGVFRLSVIWEMEHYGLKPLEDLTLTVGHLPNGMKSPATLHVVYAVDTSGRISSCDAQDEKQDAEMTVLACNELRKQFTAIPAQVSGTKIPSIQNGLVVFKEGH